MTLQDAFYILGIITMSLSLIILIVIVSAVLVIRNKIVHLHESIEQKMKIFSAAGDVAKAAKKVVKR